jgi:hypothetical protein
VSGTLERLSRIQGGRGGGFCWRVAAIVLVSRLEASRFTRDASSNNEQSFHVRLKGLVRYSAANPHVREPSSPFGSAVYNHTLAVCIEHVSDGG